MPSRFCTSNPSIHISLPAGGQEKFASILAKKSSWFFSIRSKISMMCWSFNLMDLMLKIAHEHPENLVFRRLNQSLGVTKSVIDATELFMRVNNLPPELGKGIYCAL